MHWLPWRWLLGWVAKRQGFLDPLHLLDRLRRFAQPSEVGEPLELLRAGAAFHARGLLNTRAIQYNLDWVWPFWVQRQFNPRDPSFIPRGFSFSHINLTHRNWTTVALPDSPTFPLVDPAGLITPFYDRWSLDAVLLKADGSLCIPSEERRPKQSLSLSPEYAVLTEFSWQGLDLSGRAEVKRSAAGDTLEWSVKAYSPEPGAFLVLSLRPYNPEGIALVDKIESLPDSQGWRVDGRGEVRFSQRPEGMVFSEHSQGDVLARLTSREEALPAKTGSATEIHCLVGLATAASLFSLPVGTSLQVTATVDLSSETRKLPPLHSPSSSRPQPDKPESSALPWAELKTAPRLDFPHSRFAFLYEAAQHSLLQHAPWGVVVPGPYTYRRFWFRDAAFILDAMLVMGWYERVAAVLAGYTSRQQDSGYFLSQDGEWDSNGEALWILNRFEVCAQSRVANLSDDAIRQGAAWIEKKRVASAADAAVQGLLPAGFSAEHLGPNDHYYWDAFWSQAGLQAAADLLARRGHEREAQGFARSAREMHQAIWASLDLARARRNLGVTLPASPNRRMDAGAIGSIAFGYPLQLLGDARDPSLLATVNWLMDNQRVQGAFFQDMIHSGINPYLTLHMAQVLLRAGDARHGELAQAVADLASPTGQWPEAIHPITLGGCMGDGQHIWAAAEWLLYLRNLFVREEGEGLNLGQGLLPVWLKSGPSLSFGPAPTAFGSLSLHFQAEAAGVKARLSAQWHQAPLWLRVCVPGTVETTLDSNLTQAEILLPWL